MFRIHSLWTIYLFDTRHPLRLRAGTAAAPSLSRLVNEREFFDATPFWERKLKERKNRRFLLVEKLLIINCIRNYQKTRTKELVDDGKWSNRNHLSNRNDNISRLQCMAWTTVQRDLRLHFSTKNNKQKSAGITILLFFGGYWRTVQYVRSAHTTNKKRINHTKPRQIINNWMANKEDVHRRMQPSGAK